MRDELQPLTEDQHVTDVNLSGQSPAAPKSITSITAVIAPALALVACGGGSSVGGGGESPSAGPAAPPTPQPPLVPPTGVQAGRFLAQSTMGATKTEISAIQASGYDNWINAQFAMPREMRLYDWIISKGYGAQEWFTGEYGRGFNPGVWRMVITGNDQLRQRVGVALLDFLVVSASGLTQTNFPHLAAAAYLDLLWNNTFGNYRDLIGKISTSTTMAVYLTFLNSRKADPNGSQPDENYARELMQLFTLGVVKLNADGTVQMENGKPIDTYTAADVSGLARVFTGFRYDPTHHQDSPAGHLLPLAQNAADHELGVKTFLGTTIPAGKNGFESVNIALDTIFAHPNVPPFVSKQLIQRLVTSNPSAAYVGRVSAVFANNGSGVRGDLKAVIRAILLDTEARSDTGLTDPYFGKLRAPVVRLTNWARAFGVKSENDGWKIGNTSNPSDGLGQMIGRAPSVFNFFRPGYKPPNTAIASAGLVAPEFQITTEPSVIAYVNFMLAAIGRDEIGFRPNYTDITTKAGDSQALVDDLNFLLAAGQLSAETVATIKTAVDSIAAPIKTGVDTSSNGAFAWAPRRVRLAILLVMVAPEYITQK